MKTTKNLLILLSLYVIPFTTHAQSKLEGDMNHDGALTITDVMMMIDIIMGSKPQPSFTYCPDNRHPHIIDLGLPSGTKWACCNVGATRPEEYGGYYAWGETEEKDEYTWSNYSHCEGTKSTCNNLGPTIANTQYDVAHVKWGNDWQMPSVKKIRELIQNCEYVWTSYNDVKGAWMVSKINGASVFFPAAGFKSGKYLSSSGDCGNFWSDEQSQDMLNNARYLGVDNGSPKIWSGDIRYHGQTVRPVAREMGNTDANDSLFIIYEENTSDTKDYLDFNEK